MTEIENIDLFDRYLSNQLTEVEKEAFEKQLLDPDLKLKFDLHREVVAEVTANGLSLEMAAIMAKGSKRDYTKILLWAAIIFIASTATLYVFFRTTDTEKIFITYFQPYPISAETRGSSNSNALIEAYQSGDFVKAESIINSIPEDRQSQFEALVMGNIYLMTDRPIEAARRFNAAINGESQTIKQHAEWYLVMAYLKAGAERDAVVLLDSLKDAAHLYRLKMDLVAEELN